MFFCILMFKSSISLPFHMTFGRNCSMDHLDNSASVWDKSSSKSPSTVIFACVLRLSSSSSSLLSGHCNCLF